jgi:drug/metabolite transporter (DMT)-like permease
VPVRLRHLPLAAAAGYLTLTPVFGVIGSALFLGERVSAAHLLGTGVIMGSLVALSRLRQ